MCKGMFAIVLLISALLLNSGCAKKETVKKDEPLAPTTSTQLAPPPTTVTIKGPDTTEVRQAAVTGEGLSTSPGSKSEADAIAESKKAALETIYFAYDSDVLTEQSRDSLYKSAETIIKKTSGPYALEGHCDERGSDEYNLALGEKRAKAVYKYLLTLGVAPERIATISYGEERPANPGHDETAWAKNRRVEFALKR